MNLEEAHEFITNRGTTPAAWEAVLAVVDAAVSGHWHDHEHRTYGVGKLRVGAPIMSPEREHTVHTARYPLRALPAAPEGSGALTGVLRPTGAPDGSESQEEATTNPSRRPGRTSPHLTPDQEAARLRAMLREVWVRQERGFVLSDMIGRDLAARLRREFDGEPLSDTPVDGA